TGGLIELHQALLELVAGALVKRTRFDPLHDATTEQQLFDAIPGLICDAESGAARATVRKGAETFEVELSRDQLALAAQSVSGEVLGLIHELRAAGAPVALVMPGALAKTPGLREAIEQFVGCDLLTCGDGFAAAAISSCDYPDASATGSTPLLRRASLEPH